MANEKRSERRMSVDIVLNKYINGEPHMCRAINLSRGGMLLRKIFEPDVTHHSVMLEFQLPGFPEIIRAEGVALMASPQSRAVGVRFTRMAPEALEQIDRFLEGGVAERPRRASQI
jgi:hypothetical protein